MTGIIRSHNRKIGVTMRFSGEESGLFGGWTTPAASGWGACPILAAGGWTVRGGERSYWLPLREAILGSLDLATGFRPMSTDTPTPSPTSPTPSGPAPGAGDMVAPGESDPPAMAPTHHRSRRPRQVVSIALILAGLALLIVTLRAQNIGLASTAGASITQLTTGVLGTILLVTGLALIVQAFEDSEEPPVAG